MGKTLEYNGRVTKEGDIGLPKRMRPDIIAAFHRADQDTAITVTVKRKRKTRSLPQNAYYWGVIIETLYTYFSDWSPGEWTRESVHVYLKERFLPIIFEIDRPAFVVPDTGEQIVAPYSTTKLSTADFAAYVDTITAWAAQDLQIFIAEPNDEWPNKTVDINKQSYEIRT